MVGILIVLVIWNLLLSLFVIGLLIAWAAQDEREANFRGFTCRQLARLLSRTGEQHSPPMPADPADYWKPENWEP